MAHRSHHDRDDESMIPACPACADPDPQIRHRHYLALARQEGLTFLEEHLTIHRHRVSRNDPEMIRQGIKDVVRWVGGLMQAWSGLVDAQTGAPLPWWQARQQAHQRRSVQAAPAPVPPHQVDTLAHLRTALPVAAGVADYDDDALWPEPGEED